MRRVHESCAGNHGPASAKGVVHHQTGSSTTDERAQNTQFLNPTKKKIMKKKKKKERELTPETPFRPGRIQDECESRQRDPRQCCPAYRYEDKGERGRVQEPQIRCSAAQATISIATRNTAPSDWEEPLSGKAGPCQQLFFDRRQPVMKSERGDV